MNLMFSNDIAPYLTADKYLGDMYIGIDLSKLAYN